MLWLLTLMTGVSTTDALAASEKSSGDGSDGVDRTIPLPSATRGKLEVEVRPFHVHHHVQIGIVAESRPS